MARVFMLSPCPASPPPRGGIVSVLSVVFGLVGIVAALFKLLGGNL